MLNFVKPKDCSFMMEEKGIYCLSYKTRNIWSFLRLKMDHTHMCTHTHKDNQRDTDQRDDFVLADNWWTTLMLWWLILFHPWRIIGLFLFRLLFTYTSLSLFSIPEFEHFVNIVFTCRCWYTSLCLMVLWETTSLVNNYILHIVLASIYFCKSFPSITSFWKVKHLCTQMNYWSTTSSLAPNQIPSNENCRKSNFLLVSLRGLLWGKALAEIKSFTISSWI